MDEGDYDLAGFAVGAVERTLLLPQPTISPGDILLGVASSGLHSNGYSLVRKIVSRSGLTYTSPCPWDPSKTLGSVLLEPTRIYVKQLLPAAQAGLIKGMSHITGGGFTENVPRVLPLGMGCRIDGSAWDLPDIFRFLLEKGNVDPMEMAKTFNNGIGMVLIVDRDVVDAVKKSLRENGDAEVYGIGEVTGTPGVVMDGLESWRARR